MIAVFYVFYFVDLNPAGPMVPMCLWKKKAV